MGVAHRSRLRLRGGIVLLMTAALVLALCVGVGFGVRRWWTLALPVSIGLITAAGLAIGGYPLGDTPIPFLAIAATIAVAVGVVFGRGRFGPRSPERPT